MGETRTKVGSTGSKIRAIGIDLGTTNSAAAEVVWDQASGGDPSSAADPDKTMQIRTLEIEQPTREGIYTSPLVPSVVAIQPDGTIWVGEGAKRLRAFLADYGLSFEKNLFYDTKNEMGLRKTYYRAPEAFNHASKIGGKVLDFIAAAATKTGTGPLSPGSKEIPTHFSVTVPASFQLNQRRDTLLAAGYAGLKLDDDDLLDEPTAALIDYFFEGTIPRSDGRTYSRVDSGGSAGRYPIDQQLLCVVFDFGGGTCDVSVIEVLSGPTAANFASPSRMSMSQLAVSRYHRLGGGDIDAAIVHEILIPRLIAENKLDALALTWAEKKKGLEPQLLGKAEALKIALCSEIDRLIKFDRYGPSIDKSSIVVRQPSMTCVLGTSVYTLSDPSLSAADFERLLAPFLDTNFLYARETEFRLTQSIFAPLTDALDRAGKTREDIDLCLMAGGSTLIPQVRRALGTFFPRARVVFHSDGLEAKLCVARGAAWNAIMKGITHRAFIQPILHDGIALITSQGKPNPLIPSRSPLPFPEDGSFLKECLCVPPASSPIRELRFEVVGEQDHQHIFDEVWRLPEGVSPGDEIVMEYRVTRGKQFECRAYLAKSPSVILEKTVENPLVNIANPHATKLKIEEAEEELRQRKGGTARDRGTYVALARMYAELNQLERALDYLRAAQSRLPRPDPEILNLQGIYYAELGDHERATQAYLEADRAAPLWGGPLFNLALNLRRRGLHQEALETIEKAFLKAASPGPYLAFKALCQDSLGLSQEAKETAAEAVGLFDPLATLGDWDLGWLLTSAKVAGDDVAERRAEREYQRRESRPSASRDRIPRPAIMGDERPKK